MIPTIFLHLLWKITESHAFIASGLLQLKNVIFKYMFMQFMHGSAIGESLQLCKIHRNRGRGGGEGKVGGHFG